MTIVSIPAVPPITNRAALGRAGARVVIFGSSTDQQNFLVYPAALNTFLPTAPGATKVTAITTYLLGSPVNHLMASGVFVFLGMSDPGTAYLDQRADGWARKTGPTTFELDTPDWKKGSTTGPEGRVHIMNAFGPQSWFREVYNRFNGAVELLTTFALAGETTARKKSYYAEILTLQPDIVWGAFGIGNDVQLNDIEAWVTADNVWTMVQSFIAADIICVIELPPAIVSMSEKYTSKGFYIRDQLDRKRRKDPKGDLVFFSDDFEATITPSTGKGNPNLFRDGVHGNQKQSAMNGLRGAEIARGIVNPAPDLRIASILDRKIQAGASPVALRRSRQLMDGVWNLSGGRRRREQAGPPMQDCIQSQKVPEFSLSAA